MDVMRNSTHITSCAVVTCEHKGTVSPRRHNAATDQKKMCVSHADVDMGYKLHKGGRGGKGLLAIQYDICNKGSGFRPKLTLYCQLHIMKNCKLCRSSMTAVLH